jgi:hypothetical protein
MINTTEQLYRAAHRFRIIADEGAQMLKAPAFEMAEHARASYGPHATVKEWAVPGGLVLARSVVTHDHAEYWLRSDLLDKAVAALAAEQADSNRIISEVAGWIRRTDAEGAARTGMTIDAFRARRLRDGMAWDKRRAKQRAGS